MPKRNIAVLTKDKAWKDYLIEAFNDTPCVPQFAETPEQAVELIRRGSPDIVFAEPEFVTKPMAASLAARRGSHADFRLFGLVLNGEPSAVRFDGTFTGPPPGLKEFHKRLAEVIPIPDPLKLMVVDDEPGVAEVFLDYFENRTRPTYIVETAANGEEAEAKIEKSLPHVLVMDIKMPVKNGKELYRDLKKKGLHIPTIVFFDIVTAEEVKEIRRWGNPAIVEKGADSSSMQQMSTLIKKLSYFG